MLHWIKLDSTWLNEEIIDGMFLTVFIIGYWYGFYKLALFLL